MSELRDAVNRWRHARDAYHQAIDAQKDAYIRADQAEKDLLRLLDEEVDE